jgi:hypothetical protein
LVNDYPESGSRVEPGQDGQTFNRFIFPNIFGDLVSGNFLKHADLGGNCGIICLDQNVEVYLISPKKSGTTANYCCVFVF